MPKLVVTQGPKTKNQTSQVAFTEYASIGRSSRCTVKIKNIKISRVHCEIIKDGEDFILVDLHSQNGVYVNEKRVTETLLFNEDKITVGIAEVIFLLTDADPKAAELATAEFPTQSLKTAPLGNLKK